MLLGARLLFGGKSGGWVNPYITDGLVAMWDGEWNVGGGKHDASATKWKDLSGNGRNATLIDGEWGDNYCRTTSREVQVYGAQFPSIDLTGNIKTGLIEVVSRDNKPLDLTIHYTPFVALNNQRGLNIQTQAWGTNRRWITSAPDPSTTHWTGTESFSFTGSSLGNKSYVFGNGGVLAYQGGLEMTLNTTSYSKLVISGYYLGVIGANTTDTPMSLDMHCVRVYQFDTQQQAIDTLTHNYTIDQQRFGV